MSQSTQPFPQVPSAPLGARAWTIVLAFAALIGAAAALSPLAALGIVLGAIVLVAVLADVTFLLIALVVVHMVGQPWSLSYLALPVGGLSIFPNDIVTLTLLGVVLARGFREGAVPAKSRDLVAWSVAFYLLWGVISVAHSFPSHGWSAILGFRQQFFYALLYFICLQVLAERAARRRLLVAILVAGAAVGIHGLWNVLTGTPAGNMTGSRTFRFLVVLQAMGIFFALSLLAGTVWSQRRPVWSLVLGGLYVFGILVSQARSLWLAGLAGTVAGAMGSAQWRRITLRLAVPLAALTIVAVLATGGDSLGDYVTRRAQSLENVQEDVTWVWRLFVWGEAIKTVVEKPLFGLGLGDRFVYFNPARNDWEADRQIHNSYIEIAYYTGIPGALLYGGFQLLILWRLMAAARRHTRTSSGAILGGLASCHLCLMGITFANVVSASMVATTYTWILGAVATLEIREADRH
jgi:O-antigen ligase